MVRVLLVDDSSVMRLLVKDILEEDPQITVVGRATNGKDGAAQNMELKPDVVVMDLIMGQYDGVYGVKEIMATHPTPILLLSSIGNTDFSMVIEALNAGAVDYINKPANHSTRLKDIGKDIIYKVKQVAKSNLDVATKEKHKENQHQHTFSDDLLYDAIVIGASTGGPTAVETVLSKLPSNLSVPVVVAQHMPENFVPSFVQRLDKIVALKVVFGKIGTALEPGKIIVVPSSRNVIIRRNEINQIVIAPTQKRYEDYNFPSINSVFESAAEVYGKRLIGAVLTGMGKDGTLGIIKIKEKGGYTIAQDEKTSVVFGMPKEAIKTGKVDRVVPINEIGPFMVSCLS